MTASESSGWKGFDDLDTRVDMDDDAAQRYEGACVEAIRQQIPEPSSQMQVLGREPGVARLEGKRPRSRIVLPYRDKNGVERQIDYPLWSEGRIESSNPQHLAHPNDIADIIRIQLEEVGGVEFEDH